MAKETTLNEIGETLAFIVERMAKKDDVLSIIRAEVPGIVRAETHDIRQELISIRRDLAVLTQRAENNVGLTKEIDHALERIGDRKTPRHRKEDRRLLTRSKQAS